ncbi:MAG: TolB family protein [Sporichthyaceae bacterium]
MGLRLGPADLGAGSARANSRWLLPLAVGLSAALLVAAGADPDAVDVRAEPTCAASAGPGAAPWTRAVTLSENRTSRNFPQQPTLSADGTTVAFATTNGTSNHVYVRRIEGCTLEIASSTATGKPADYANTLDVDHGGGEFDTGSFAPSLSADGRRVAFHSSAVDLVSDDGNRSDAPNTDATFYGERSDPRTGFDVFVKDLERGTVVRASVAATGEQANGESVGASLSADGGTVAFLSNAANLVPGDTNGTWDVFVKDLDSGAIERVSTSAAGREMRAGAACRGGPPYRCAAVLSADASAVAFVSEAAGLVPGDRNGAADVFVKRVGTGTVARVSAPAPGGREPGRTDAVGGLALSETGDVVAFGSAAALVAEDRNERGDVFVRDLVSGRLDLVSRTPAGEPFEVDPGPDTDGDPEPLPTAHSASLSSEGDVVVFLADAPGLIDADANARTSEVVVLDLTTGAMQSFAVARDSDAPAISAARDRIVYLDGFGDAGEVRVVSRPLDRAL